MILFNKHQGINMNRPMVSKGIGIVPGVIEGFFHWGDTIESFINCPPKTILFVESATPDIVLSFDNCIGIVSIKGGITSHAALLAREFGIPCIVNVDYIFNSSFNGSLVTIDSTLGIITIK